MRKIEHQRCGKMGILHLQHKRQVNSRNRDAAVGGKAVGLGARQVCDEGDGRRPGGGGAEEADAARLDQAFLRGGGAARDKGAVAGGDAGPVVGDEAGAEGEELQAEGGLAGAGGAEDEEAAVCHGDAGGVQEQRVGRRCRHTGRPTTKRAPKGSLVASAAVGRMFSAQITPPCASTICFEIDRPRPELLPKWVGGRSE